MLRRRLLEAVPGRFLTVPRTCPGDRGSPITIVSLSFSFSLSFSKVGLWKLCMLAVDASVLNIEGQGNPELCHTFPAVVVE